MGALVWAAPFPGPHLVANPQGLGCGQPQALLPRSPGHLPERPPLGKAPAEGDWQDMGFRVPPEERGRADAAAPPPAPRGLELGKHLHLATQALLAHPPPPAPKPSSLWGILLGSHMA